MNHALVSREPQILDDFPARPPSPIALRPPRPGAMGWVVQAHGAYYAREFGWDHRCEATAAAIVAAFLRSCDPAWDWCWIAERDGASVGSIFVIRQSDEIAKLRLLLVDPAARGSGLGRTLVRACIRFARAAGYCRLRLWTTDALTAARHIYAGEGFQLIAQTPHTEFGPAMIAETWELTL